MAFDPSKLKVMVQWNTKTPIIHYHRHVWYIHLLETTINPAVIDQIKECLSYWGYGDGTFEWLGDHSKWENASDCSNCGTEVLYKWNHNPLRNANPHEVAAWHIRSTPASKVRGIDNSAWWLAQMGAGYDLNQKDVFLGISAKGDDTNDG